MTTKEPIQAWGSGRRLAVVLILSLAAGGCSDSDSTAKEEGKTGDAADQPVTYAAEKVGCGLFTAEDAAAVLGVPAASVRVDAQELYAGNWNCSFNGGGLDKLVSFNISLSDSSKEAAMEMAQYRSHLDIARGVKPFAEDTKEGAYSEVDGVGDEALWTPVNGTLAVRKGNVSLQISLPKERDVQVGIAKTFLSRL